MRPRAPRTCWSVLLLSALPLALAAQEQQTQPDPQRYEETIRAWEAEDATNPPPENAIVITGSSSITRWNAEMIEDLAPLTVIPRGFGGSRMLDVAHYVDRLLVAYNPRAVVVYEGDNDTGDGMKAETIVGHFEQIVSRIHEALPETRIYAMSVKPSVLRWGVWPEAQRVNRILQAMAAEDDLLFYIDVASPFLKPDGQVMTDIFVEDGLHLNEKGTDIWAASIKRGLMPVEAHFESAHHESAPH